MEKLDEKLRRTAKKYLSDTEFIHADSDLAALGIYWCAKEALYKLYGKKKISFKNSIYIKEFTKDENQVSGILTDEEITVSSRIYIRWFDNYCLSIAL